MFKQSKLRTQRQQNGIFINSFIFILIIIPLILRKIDYNFSLNVSKYNIFFLIGGGLLFLFQLTHILIRNQAHKGMKYAMCHYIISYNIRSSLLDGNYYNKRFYFNNEIADLPKIKLDFYDDMSKGKLFIQNIKINKDFDNVNISSALGNFIVERLYLSNDENYHVFEIYDSKINQQLTFNSLKELKDYNSELDDYTLFIDKHINIPLQGCLIVGMTGSGKTYALYSLVLSMLTKRIHYNLFFADPKMSSLAVLGEIISSKNTATKIDEIITLLKEFDQKMQERKSVLKDKLSLKLEATYADFDLEPHIFIFDEFTSFQTVLKTRAKKERDEVESLLSGIVLQGRQLGFFLYFVMQKSDSTNLPTYIRENLPVKFVLSNAEPQTYITTFGSGVEIPNKNFKLGQGVFTCPNIANTPKICHFSYLNFDILDAVINT